MRIAVFGGLNIDVSIFVPRLPTPDESMQADRIERFFGGKGANQAVAAARMGDDVSMIGCVGDDPGGADLLVALRADGVEADHVRTVAGATGQAFPIVAGDDVMIPYHQGANAMAGVDVVEAAVEVIAAADVLMLQSEVNAAGSRRAAEIAHEAHTTVLFNAAPVVDDVVEAVLPLTDVLVVNRTERAAIDPPAGLETVTTLGAEGVDVGGEHIDAFPAESVDPTGAGDAFAGALAVGLAAGLSLTESARIGAAAGSLAVGRAGAQPSLPTREEVERLHPFPTRG